MTGYVALHGGAGLVERRPAGAVLVRGPDALDYLQSIVSQDLLGLEPGHGAHSLLLQPTGKLDVDFRILRVAGPDGPDSPDGREFWLDTQPGWGERLAASLRRFLLRMKVEVVDRSDEWGVVSVRGPDAIRVVEAAWGGEVPAAAHHHVGWGEVLVVRADWPGVPGVDLVGPSEALQGAVPAMVDHGAVPASELEWEVARVEAGVPRLGAELTDEVIPQEARLDEVAVSFEKGCFLGQELVCRIRDRGHVNRLLRRVVVEGPGLPTVGADVVDGGKAVGSLTSVVESPVREAAVGLGYLRRQVAPGASVTVRWEHGEATARVEEVVPAG